MVRLVDSISASVNYQVTTIDHSIKKIAGNPSAVKKVLQLANKIFEAMDLYYIGSGQKRDITEASKGTIDLIGFFGTYKNLMYWVNPFSKESLDQQALRKSIKSSLCASHRNKKEMKAQKFLAGDVFKEIMAGESYHSRGEILDALKASLVKRGYKEKKAKQIAERVIVQQKSRPIVQIAYSACFTVADLGGNLMTLKKWRILDLAPLAASIGSKSRVFMVVVNFGVDRVLGTVASAGLILVVGDAAYRSINQAIKLYYAADTEEEAAAYKELRNAILDLLASSVDLAATVAPLLFVLNPPVIVALAIVAKGTGVFCILIR
jgi:hypothetical protein